MSSDLPAKTHCAMYNGMKHPYTIRINKKEVLFRQLLPKSRYFVQQTPKMFPPIIMILTSSNLEEEEEVRNIV